MKKLAIIAAMCAALTLGGCKPGDVAGKIMDGIEDVSDAIKAGIGYGKTVANKYCADVYDAVAASNVIASQVGASCKAKNEVHRIAAGVASFCANVDTINSSSIASVLAVLKKAKTDARSVVAAGC